VVQSIVPEDTGEFHVKSSSDQIIDILPPGGRLRVGGRRVIFTENDRNVSEIISE
jgi:hypothetical protein